MLKWSSKMMQNSASENSPSRQRLLVIGLDGYEAEIAGAMMAAGELPRLNALISKSATIDLDHGRNKLTGLSWQHMASAQAPRDSGLWSAVEINPKSYFVQQPMVTGKPFLAQAGERAVILDAPYFDLASCPSMNGFVNWGAHDPGVEAYCRPSSLYQEIEARFGAYPATDDIYAFTWPDADACRKAGENLCKALKARSDITRWVLSERLPDWDMAITVVSELHSAIEPLWHGFDASHPLNAHPSAEASKEGLYDIYRELDDMIGDMEDAFPDAALALFWMHGMGPNDADAASMILLPELLYRHAFKQSNFEAPVRWRSASNAPPQLEPGETWSDAVFNEMKRIEARRAPAVDRAMARLKRMAANAVGGRTGEPASLHWMPSYAYGFAWPDMPAFALPSFYDGRIRLNVQGREANGVIPADQYSKAMDEIEQLLRECRDIRTGAPVVGEIHRTSPDDPMATPDSNGDLEVIWTGDTLGIVHPELGEIGPVPYRRTGGHTGGLGQFILSAHHLAPGHHGVSDAMDVPATLEDWLSLKPDGVRSGTSFLAKLVKEPAPT